jgi:hypothetical protein
MSGRYLSFVEREDIAMFRVQGLGVREIARRLWGSTRVSAPTYARCGSHEARGCRIDRKINRLPEGAPALERVVVTKNGAFRREIGAYRKGRRTNACPESGAWPTGGPVMLGGIVPRDQRPPC